MKENEIDLSGFDDAIKEEDIDLSGFDESVDLSEFETPEEVSEPSILDEVPSQIKNPLIGAAAGKAVKTIANKSGDKLKDIAEELAYSAVGGDNTPTGKTFLKNQLSQLGDLPEKAITTKTLGRRALDEGLIDIFKGRGKAFDESEDLLLQSIRDKKAQLDKITKKKDLSKVSKKMEKDLLEKIDLELGGKDDEKLLKGLLEEEGRLQGQRSLSDLEKEKVKIQESVKYKPGIEPLGRSDEKIRRSKAKALRELVEEGVAEEGSEALEEFIKNKKDIGERSILRDMLLDRSYKDSVSPTIGFRDLATTGVGGPALTATDKVLRKKGAAIGSKVSDVLSKLGKSKVVDKLPVVGALAGLASSFSEAKAAGLGTGEAIGEAVKEEGIDTALGAFAPEKIARDPSESVYHKIAQGKKLTPEEMELVKPYDFKQSDNKGVQVFGDQLETIKETDDKDEAASKMFQLQQQPAFRELMRRQGKEVKEADSPLSDLTKKYEGTSSTGYVPEGSSKSGVTVATGLDLGNFGDLSKLDIPQELKAKLEPFMGLRGDDARQVASQLNLSDEEVQAIDNSMGNYNNSKVSKLTQDLPEELQNPDVEEALDSFYTNTPSGAKALIDRIKAGNVDEAIDKGVEWNKSGGKFMAGNLKRRMEELHKIYPDRKEQIEAEGKIEYDKYKDQTKLSWNELNPLKDIERNIDRVNRQIGSGDDMPINQMDDLLGSLQSLDVAPEQLMSIEDQAVNMRSVNDGEALKDMLRKLQEAGRNG